MGGGRQAACACQTQARRRPRDGGWQARGQGAGAVRGTAWGGGARSPGLDLLCLPGLSLAVASTWQPASPAGDALAWGFPRHERGWGPSALMVGPTSASWGTALMKAVCVASGSQEPAAESWLRGDASWKKRACAVLAVVQAGDHVGEAWPGPWPAGHSSLSSYVPSGRCPPRITSLRWAAARVGPGGAPGAGTPTLLLQVACTAGSQPVLAGEASGRRRPGQSRLDGALVFSGSREGLCSHFHLMGARAGPPGL